jgi:hypothetical protein
MPTSLLGAPLQAPWSPGQRPCLLFPSPSTKPFSAANEAVQVDDPLPTLLLGLWQGQNSSGWTIQ